MFFGTQCSLTATDTD